jgi:glycine cleavage system H protein
MNYPEELRYALSHEWVRTGDDGVLTVGISDFAQDSLGDVVYVDLPEVGATFEAGEPFAEIESTKSVNEIFAPVSGTITAVNEALHDQPELVNAEPYGTGWLVQFTPDEGASYDRLGDAARYAESVAE